MFRTILVLVFVFLSAGVFAAPPGPVAQPVEIVSAEFGIFDASEPRELLFEPSAIVPHRQGQRYGWVIEVRTTRRSLSVSEEYLLPNNPKNVTHSVGDSTVVFESSHYRRNQVSQRQLVPVEGRIYGEWAVGPGEPAGRRHLQVVIEGQVAAGFEFEVK